MPIAIPGPGVKLPSSSMVDPTRLPSRTVATRTTTMIASASAHHQYSLRLARPSNRAYFLQ
ncbi:hypothetical protein BJ963_002130 [Leifsonia soli]|uniref:Uncharacterized protein n=1 Tax=Leifsonia soli TaxID=582665 RepID=A0A852T147_9MICO|nr:hypothetical protein [Leifsonia soli]